jgi:hypothetical protein
LPLERSCFVVIAIWAEDEEAELVVIGHSICLDVNHVSRPLGIDFIAQHEGAEDQHGQESASLPIAPPSTSGRKGLRRGLLPYN